MRRLTPALVILFLALPASAESVWLGGLAVADTTQVAYAGRLATLPGQRLSDGWSYSLFADHVAYEYDRGTSRVDARATSARLGLSRQTPVLGGSFTYGAGILARDTHLSPQDPGNENVGFHVRALTELQWQSRDDASWRSAFYGQYVFGARSDYVKLFVGRRLFNEIAVGPQVWTGSDPTYRVYGTGIAVDGWRMGQARITAVLGAEHAEGGSTRPAAGIEFSLYRN